MPTLSKFMNMEDIPKRYGGKLDFDWGDLPHLDDEARAALSKDGNDGWVKGPTLWLDHKRVVVGAENGKLRRSVPDVEKMKPIVYAADDTPEPVHRERRASSITAESLKEKVKALHGTAKLEKIQSANVVPTTAHAATTTAIAAETNVVKPPATAAEHKPEPLTTDGTKEAEAVPAVTVDSAPTSKAEPVAAGAAAGATVTTAIPNTAGIPAENIHKSPQGSAVNLPPPKDQPGFPQQTAEYISSSPKSDTKTTSPSTLSPETAANPPAASSVAAVTAGTAAAAATGTAAAVAASSHSNSGANTSSPSPHPPAIPAPGPAAEHTVQVNKAIAERLTSGGESVSVLPAEQNGAVPHPDMLVSSDRSKGLAVEKDKVEGAGTNQRPPAQHFVTAAEF